MFSRESSQVLFTLTTEALRGTSVGAPLEAIRSFSPSVAAGTSTQNATSTVLGLDNNFSGQSVTTLVSRIGTDAAISTALTAPQPTQDSSFFAESSLHSTHSTSAASESGRLNLNVTSLTGVETALITTNIPMSSLIAVTSSPILQNPTTSIDFSASNAPILQNATTALHISVSNGSLNESGENSYSVQPTGGSSSSTTFESETSIKISSGYSMNSTDTSDIPLSWTNWSEAGEKSTRASASSIANVTSEVVNRSEFDTTFIESISEPTDFTTFDFGGFTTPQEFLSEVVVPKTTNKASDGVPVATSASEPLHIGSLADTQTVSDLEDSTDIGTPLLSKEPSSRSSDSGGSILSGTVFFRASSMPPVSSTLASNPSNSTSTMQFDFSSAKQMQTTRSAWKMMTALHQEASSSLQPTSSEKSTTQTGASTLIKSFTGSDGLGASTTGSRSLILSSSILYSNISILSIVSEPGESKSKSSGLVSLGGNVTTSISTAQASSESSSTVLDVTAQESSPDSGTSTASLSPPVVVLSGLETLGPVEVLLNRKSMGVPPPDVTSRYQPYEDFEIIIPAGAWKSDRRDGSAPNPLTVTIFKPPVNYSFPGQICGLAIDLGPLTQQLAKPILISLPCKRRRSASNQVVQAFRLDSENHRWTSEMVSWNISGASSDPWVSTQNLGTHMALLVKVVSSSSNGLSVGIGTIVGVTVGTAAIISAITFVFRRRLGCGNAGYLIRSIPFRRRRLSVRLGFYVTTPNNDRVWVDAASATPEYIQELSKMNPEFRIEIPRGSLDEPGGPQTTISHDEGGDSMRIQVLPSVAELSRVKSAAELEGLDASHDSDGQNHMEYSLIHTNEPGVVCDPEPAKLESYEVLPASQLESLSSSTYCAAVATAYFAKKASMLVQSEEAASDWVQGPVSGSSTYSVPDNLSRGESMSTQSETMSRSSQSAEEISFLEGAQASTEAAPIPPPTPDTIRPVDRPAAEGELAREACAPGGQPSDSPLARSDPGSGDWPSTPLACLSSLNEFWKYPLPTIEEPAYREDMSEPPTMVLDPKDFAFLQER